MTYRELIRKEAEKRFQLCPSWFSPQKYQAINEAQNKRRQEEISFGLWLLKELNIDPDSVKPETK